jgi:hypothetical protein
MVLLPLDVPVQTVKPPAIPFTIRFLLLTSGQTRTLIPSHAIYG